MKISKVIYALITLSICGCTESNHNTVKDHTLNGNIKSVKYYQATAITKNNSVTEVDKKPFTEYYYDNAGTLIREMKLNGYDNIYTYKYNSKGYKQVTYINDKNSKYNYKIIFIYDEKNRIISEKSYRDVFFYDGQVKIKYDTKGNILLKTVYDQKNKFNNSISFLYDNDGNIITSTYQSCYDATPFISQYKQSPDGRIIEIITTQNKYPYTKKVYTDWDKFNNPIRYIDYVYDINENQIASTINHFEYEYY